VAAHSEDPVGAELEALLEQPEIRQRLDESNAASKLARRDRLLTRTSAAVWG
jgi:hypothetical protein